MDSLDCNSRDCSFCAQLRRQDYIGSRREARDRLATLIDQRMQRGYTIPVITDTFDWEYQEWVDNNLSLGGTS